MIFGASVGNARYKVSGQWIFLPFFSPFINSLSTSFYFKSDLRQFGGLLFGLAICAIFFPLASLAGQISGNGGTVTAGVPLSSLIGGLCDVLIGLVGVNIGYLCLVHDYGHQYLTGFLLVFVQTAFIGYITFVVDIGMTARTGMGFIPAGKLVAKQNWIVRNHHSLTLSCIMILSVQSFRIGCTLCWSHGNDWYLLLWHFLLGNTGFHDLLHLRLSGWKARRSLCFLLQRSPHLLLRTSHNCGPCSIDAWGLRFEVSVTQAIGACHTPLMSPAHLTHSPTNQRRRNVGMGPLPNGPVIVGVFVVSFPEMSIFVGLVYVLNGMFGVARSYRIMATPEDNTLQLTVAFQFLCTLVLMVITQISWLPGDAGAGAAPTVACVTFGTHIIVPFLDYKARTMPEVITLEYYGLEQGKEMPKSEDIDEKDVEEQA